MLNLEDAIYKVKQAAEIYERASFNANVEPDSWRRRELVEKAEAAETRLDNAILMLVVVAKAEETEAARDTHTAVARSAIYAAWKARRAELEGVFGKIESENNIATDKSDDEF